MTMEEHRLSTTRTARVQCVGDLEAADEVWMVLHGFGQLASDFLLPFTAIAGPTRAIVAPEALNKFYHVSGETGRRDGRRVGATWMTREDRDVEIDDYVTYLDNVAESVRARAQADGARLLAGGVDVDALDRARLARRYPRDRVGGGDSGGRRRRRASGALPRRRGRDNHRIS